MSSAALDVRTDMDRLQWQERIAAANGFSLPPTFFAVGTDLVEVGRDKYRQSRTRFEELPPAKEALATLIGRIVAEERRDVSKRLSGLRMLPSGEVCNGNDTSRALLTGPSFRQLLARTGMPEPSAAATYLATVPADRRAAEVNHWLGKASPDTTAVLRCRNASGLLPADLRNDQAALQGAPREVYAVVSERYTSGFEVSALAEILTSQAIAPGDARAAIEYDGQRGSIRLMWHSNVQPERVKVGEVYYAFAGFSAEDDGTSSIEPTAGLGRAVCINLTTMDAVLKLGRKRHTGGEQSMARFIFDAIHQAVNHVRDFALAWDSAAAERIDTPGAVRDVPAGAGPLAIAEGVYRGLLKTQTLALPGYRGEAAVTELMSRYRAEPEPTRVGIVNGITRAAHESTLRHPWAAGELETAGGAILTSKRPFSYVHRGDDF